MLEIIIGILGAVAGAMVVWGAESLYQKCRERRGKWKGEWLATLAAQGAQSERQDRWTFRQRGDTVYAKIIRQKGDPAGVHSRWNFIGQDRESQLFGAYENVDIHSVSYGGIMFNHLGLGKYDGYYLRLENGKIVQMPIVLERMSGGSEKKT